MKWVICAVGAVTDLGSRTAVTDRCYNEAFA